MIGWKELSCEKENGYERKLSTKKIVYIPLLLLDQWVKMRGK